MATVEVLLVGRLRGAEPIVSDSLAGTAFCRVTELDSVEAALERVRAGAAPELIVVAQDWPGEITAGELDALRAAAPLAPICLLLGSCCEGELRSGRPWPGAVRCYWHQWPARFRQVISALTAGQTSLWHLPATALPEEAVLSEAPARLRKRPPQGLLAIIAADAQSGAAWSDAARARGYQTVSLRAAQGSAVRGAKAAIWDARPEEISDARAVRVVLEAVGQAPLVAITGFPRPEDIERAQAAGVAAVLSKPLVLRDLFWQLEQLR